MWYEGGFSLRSWCALNNSTAKKKEWSKEHGKNMIEKDLIFYRYVAQNTIPRQSLSLIHLLDMLSFE
jgi:hypothetical protein